MKKVQVDAVFPPPETSLPDCFGSHLHHLRPVRRSVVSWGKGAKRYGAVTRNRSL